MAMKIDLLVDKEKNRVVFAESGKEFVDTLLSFLTLPMGTIVRILGKQSSVGCLDKLYESVQNLHIRFFHTPAHSKRLLLRPRNESDVECANLLIDIDDSKSMLFSCNSHYYCQNYSLICGGECPSCFHPMTTRNSQMEILEKIGSFLESYTAWFIITDDFQIIPLSTASTVAAVLQQFEIKSVASLERKTVEVEEAEVLCLLKAALLSTSPLSDVFLMKPESNLSVAADHKFIGINLYKTETDSNPADGTDSRKFPMKLLYSILSNKFLHAEVGGDFADLLFGILTFPLGSIVKILNKESSLGCVDNLYKSVEHLGIGHYFISEKEMEMLLDPKLYSKRMAIVPKLPDSLIEKGGFVKPSSKFAVSNDMLVTPLSTFSIIDIYKGLDEPISSLAEMEVSIGEAEVLNLLKACFASPAPLKELFLAKQGPKE